MVLTLTGRPGWDPFAEMRRAQEQISHFFTELERPADVTFPTAFPAVNLWVSEGTAVVTAELPGVTEENLELAASEDTLSIRGKCEPIASGMQASWHRQERYYGDFSRTVQLPFRIDPNRIQARLLNGVLEVELPRPETDKPRRIRVSTG